MKIHERFRESLIETGRWAVLVFFSVAMAFPFYWMLIPVSKPPATSTT
jgi:ABC-type glycerol-3-phosphate transport system permease component